MFPWSLEKKIPHDNGDDKRKKPKKKQSTPKGWEVQWGGVDS